METIHVLLNVGEYETTKVFWKRTKILELSLSDRNGVLLEGLVRYSKFNSYESTDCKVPFLNCQHVLKTFQTHFGAKGDSASTSVWIFKDEEEPAFDASLLRISDGSGTFAPTKGKCFSGYR